MATYKTLMLSGSHGGSLLAWNRLWYATPGCGASGTTNVGDALNAETRRRHYVYANGTLSNLAARRSTAGGSDTVTMRKNSADTAMAVSTTSAGELGVDTNTASVAVGDYLTLKHTTSACFYNVARCIFETVADNTQVTLYTAAPSFTPTSEIAAAGATKYFPFAGGTGGTATEANAKIKTKIAGTFKNLSVYVFKYPAQSGNGSSVLLRSRKNGAYGNIAITIPAHAFGLYSDLSAMDTVAVDDDYCFECEGPSSGSVKITVASCEFYPTTVNGDHEVFTGDDQLVTISASGGDQFFPVSGDLGTSVASDAAVSMSLGMDCGARLFRCKVAANTCNSTQTFTVMKNGVATTLTFDVGATLTGEFVDATHSISLLAADTISIRVTGGGAGSLSVQYIAMLIPGAASSAPTGDARVYGQIFGC